MMKRNKIGTGNLFEQDVFDRVTLARKYRSTKEGKPPSKYKRRKEAKVQSEWRRRIRERRANELEARKREATVIRRMIEPSLRDDPDWK